MAAENVRALVFDVFGTVVDWRGTVIREGEALSSRLGRRVDWGRFADTWRREGYFGAMAKIRDGGEAYRNVDILHREMLEKLLPEYRLTGLSETEIADFNRVWHRLDPWPDSVAGLTRLKQRFIISPLSNGTFAILTNLAKHGGLPWDCIISTELGRTFKPDPAAYRLPSDLLDLPPAAVMMVAAHVDDLQAARSCGLRTAFVARPLEWGPGGQTEPEPDPDFDYIATDFVDLARQLGV